MIEEVVALRGRSQTIAFTHEQIMIKYILFRQIPGETPIVGCQTRFKNHIDQCLYVENIETDLVVMMTKVVTADVDLSDVIY